MPSRRARRCSSQPPVPGRILPLLACMLALLAAPARAQAPAAVTDLAAVRGTTRNDGGGLVPPTPSYPPGPPWVLTPVAASGQTDEPVTRDAWSYVVFVKNGTGDVSAVSNQTAPAPNYALGDVADGVTPGSGDNTVDDLDISLLVAHYGISGAPIVLAGVTYLDVGPTMDLSMNTRPFTDGRIDFEDLVVFATNYHLVSSPGLLVANADAADRKS